MAEVSLVILDPRRVADPPAGAAALHLVSHFAYGALAVLPVRDALTRHLGFGRRSALYVAVESVFAVSALYEIFEWLLTLTMEGSLATAYNGQQGDLWDAQKDMALAGLGALLAAGALAMRSRND